MEKFDKEEENENPLTSSGDSQELLTGDVDKLTLEDDDDDLPIVYNLDTIPVEIFLHVCTFIEARFLIRRVSLVCKKFRHTLLNELTWKIRQNKRWGFNGVYPPIPVDEDSFCWAIACIKREEQIKLWGNDGKNLRHVELHSHIACVDAVHLFNGGRFLASGSRDRSVVIWDVEKCFTESIPTTSPTVDGNGSKASFIAGNAAQVKNIPKAHQGWIWAFASNSKHFLSASWDTSVKVWDKQTFDITSVFTTTSACLALGMVENLVACGTFDKKIFMFDPRAGFQPIGNYNGHKKCVLALGLDEDKIITCGEDGKCCLYDLRAKKIRARIDVPFKGAYPTCLSFRPEDPASLFYIGDRKGNIHLVDSVAFKIVKSYESVHGRPVQGIFHGLGSVFTCSSDGNMKILEPSLGLKTLTSLKIDAELPSVHCLNNNVALAGGDSIVRLWSPIEGF